MPNDIVYSNRGRENSRHLLTFLPLVSILDPIAEVQICYV